MYQKSSKSPQKTTHKILFVNLLKRHTARWIISYKFPNEWLNSYHRTQVFRWANIYSHKYRKELGPLYSQWLPYLQTFTSTKWPRNTVNGTMFPHSASDFLTVLYDIYSSGTDIELVVHKYLDSLMKKEEEEYEVKDCPYWRGHRFRRVSGVFNSRIKCFEVCSSKIEPVLGYYLEKGKLAVLTPYPVKDVRSYLENQSFRTAPKKNLTDVRGRTYITWEKSINNP